MNNQQKELPVNLEKAEFIISLSSQKTGLKSIMGLLRETESQFLARQKENKAFHRTSQIIEHGYSKKIQADKQLIKRIQYDVQQEEKEIDRLASRRRGLQQALDGFENELAGDRAYAEQRRNKKSKRERQYHQLYHVPLVATQFKKKYIRARDKNSDAEEQVSTTRSKVESCQQDIARLSKSMGDIQKHKEQSLQQCKDMASQLKTDQELIFQLQEGRKFIASFDQYQWVTAQKATAQFMASVQSCYAKDQTHKIRDPNQHFVKIFKLALFEYGEAEKFADDRWGHTSSIQVPFTCTKCKSAHVGWPKLDKIRVNDFICDTCYQDHTIRIIEKEDKQQQQQTKPGFKKMMKKMINNNKGKQSNGHLISLTG